MAYRTLSTDRILEQVASPGLGPLSLGTPVNGFRAFSSILIDADTCAYYIESVDNNGAPTGDWERGFATFHGHGGATSTLTRSMVMDSSNIGNFVDFNTTTSVRVGITIMSETISVSFLPGGRLSVSGTDSVTDGESNTLYYIPYLGEGLPLFNGYGLQTVMSSSASVQVNTLPAGSAYDVFAYVWGGVRGILKLELNAWADPNTRKDTLVYYNGFLCKTGDPTRRYLGSIYIGTAGLVQDWSNYQGTSQNPSKRFVWNLYNRVRRDCQMFDATVGWTIPANNSWRVIHGLTPPQGCMEVFRGLDDDLVEANGLVNAAVQPNGNYYSAIGVDSNIPMAESSLYGNFNNTTNKAVNLALPCAYFGRPGIGYHTIQLLERLQTGAATGGSDSQSGLLGVVFA
jgi:hypothetical protein